jgi:uncharacterized protein (TIGR03083 family)
VWAAIDDQRRTLVHLLEDLSKEEWRQPSLCEGWTVRQVAVHLAPQNTTWPTMPRAVLDLIRHGGMNGAIHAMGCRHAELPVEVIIGEIRDRIGVWRPVPAVTFRETAIDYLVHGQDIAVPLGRTLPMPPGLAVIAADRVWSSPRMFHARKVLAGYRLVADDAPWAFAAVGLGVRHATVLTSSASSARAPLATASEYSIVSRARVIVTVVMALIQQQHGGRGWRCGRGALQQRGAGRPAEHMYLGRSPRLLNDSPEHLA